MNLFFVFDTRRIIQNAVYCSECRKYLVSEFPNDHNQCPHQLVNGGHDYIQGWSAVKQEHDFTLYSDSTWDETLHKILIKIEDDYVLMKSLSLQQLENMSQSIGNKTALQVLLVKEFHTLLKEKINF
jgi:hypothetical protein